MRKITVIRRDCRKNTSVVTLLAELRSDPMHSLYIEAQPGLEQDMLLFRINQLAGKLRLNLYTRSTPAGVWVRCPAPTVTATVQTPDEVRIAIIGIEGERQICLMVHKTTAGTADLEAVALSLDNRRKDLRRDFL